MDPTRTDHSRRRRLTVLLALAVPLALLPGQATATETSASGCRPVTLDHAGSAHGALLAEQYAADGVHMSAIANEGRPNQLVAFDSGHTGTPDPDLQAGIGVLAIIPEDVNDANGDGLVDRPSDSIRGGTQRYVFDSPRTVHSFQIVDVDHGLALSHHATAYDEAGTVLARVPIAIGADGNVQTVVLGVSGVRRLDITYRDSAGVTGLDLDCPPGAGGEGCTPGYWKQPQHADSWTAPYDPDDLFAAHFEDAFPGMTLLQVLGQGGGGLNALGRHTVAALLNAASPDVDSAFTRSQVVSEFGAAYPGSASSYEQLKDRFAAENERGCPLS